MRYIKEWIRPLGRWQKGWRGWPLAAALLFLGAAAGGAAETPSVLLRFDLEPRGSYRRITKVDERVLYDGQPAHTARIVNRAVISPRGEGEFLARFQTSEEAERGAQVYRWMGEETARYRRGARGELEMLTPSVMPVLRGFPGFPEERVQEGGSWMAEAREVHDFRDTLGSEAVVRFPLRVQYTLEKILPEKPRQARIRAEYNVFHRVESPPRGNPHPIARIMGNSSRTFLWDIEAGRMTSSRERFTFVFELQSGHQIEYRGTAETRVVFSEPLDRSREKKEISEALDMEVETREEGVAILLEDVFFEPDSTELRESQRASLDRLSRLLREEYPGRELRVIGHAARVGREEYLQGLSEDRARRVAEYLMEQEVRAPGEIWVQGRGSREPRASNETEAGRRRNRRVEIIILDEQ